jgi:uncharacterized protein (TIGR02466 family)
MKKNILFSLDTYEFQCDNGLVDEVYNEIITLDKSKQIFWNHNGSNPSLESFNGYMNAETSKCFYNEKLLDWVTKCFNKVSQEKYKQNLSVVDSWVTKTGFLAGSGWHDHTMSILSGVLYFNTPSPIEFKYTDPYHAHCNLFRHPDFPNISDVTAKVTPTKGTFMIFPSHLAHRITPNKSKSDRYSLAFNTFFTGELCGFRTTRLTLNSKEIE